jgi:hypothetical protein
MRVPRAVAATAAIAVVFVCARQPAASPADVPVTWAEQAVQDPAPVSDEAAALAAARTSGRRVEVVGARSETGQLFANPDGTFTDEESVTPVRVRRGDGWVQPDATLDARPDGTVVPRAVPVTMRFSGGGGAPLVRLGHDGKELTLTWPAALPVPTLSGDTATYHDVMPGVDLRMRATTQGFSEVLVVKTRAAAAQPGLAAIHFGLSTSGLSVRGDETGGLGAYDAAGALVFGSGAPSMWDSSTSPAGAVPGAASVAAGADRPGTASRLAVAGLLADRDQLTLRPDLKLLTDPGTRFPVYVDPDFTAGRTGWTLVLQGVTQPKWNGANDDPLGKSGYSDWDTPTVRYRTYFQFDTSAAIGKAVKSAEFNVLEEWAPSCDARPVHAYGTNAVSPSTYWGNQPYPGGSIDLGTNNVAFGHPGCEDHWVGWNAVAAVRSAVSRGSATTTIMVQAEDETDAYAWKKWTAWGPNSPRIIVTYNSYPNRPTGITAEQKACALAPNEPYVNPLNPSGAVRGPTLRAKVGDPDGGSVRAHFEWYQRGGAKLGETTTPAANAGTVLAVTVPSGTYADGAKASYRVRGFDGADYGPWSGWCDVSIDRTRPDKKPVVTSGTYPENDLGGSVGFTGAFTFAANGVSDVVGYLYDLHDSPRQYVKADRLGGSATALVTPLDDRPMDLFVRSVDRAGNVSDSYDYHFNVNRATPPVADWRLNGLIETRVVDSSPQHHDGTFTVGPARWVTGHHDDALFFDGSSGYVSTTNGPAVRTDRSFSVAAWVRLERAGDAWQVAVSQDGNRAAGFYLQYASDVKKWSFNMMRSDVDNATPDRAVSDGLAQTGVWTHLVGTYDPATGRMQLFVNGVAQKSTGTHSTPWTNATGTAQLGRVRWNGGYSGYWLGAVDDVRVYDRVIQPDEIVRLASNPVTEQLFLPLDESAGGTAADVSGNYRGGQLNSGASWTTGQIGTGAVALNGTSGAVTTGKPAVRTDQSFMVSAMVRVDDASRAQAAVSQDGPRSSGFTLAYWPATHGWMFVVSVADGDNPALVKVDSAALGIVAAPGVPTHLVGVYDAVAGEVRLYVDASLAGRANGRPTASVDGAVVIGRNKLAGQPTSYWKGAIDDVHVWSGVDDGVALETLLDPSTTRSSAYGEQLSRFVNHPSEHITASGAAPAGYHFERSLGTFAPVGAENTRMLYMCRVGGTDEFTSADPACEGQEVLGPLGLVYGDPPDDAPSIPVYRCSTAGGEHFDSNDPGCEGLTTDALLGYSLAYAHLIRHISPSSPYDHASATTLVPADYLAEVRLGLVALSAEPGTVPLWSCVDGTDSFTSTDAACEGRSVVSQVGRIWPVRPDEVASHELFRCRASWGDLFESTDPGCEGQTVDRLLGYLRTT